MKNIRPHHFLNSIFCPSMTKQFLRDCYGRRSLDINRCQSTKYLLKLCYTLKRCSTQNYEHKTNLWFQCKTVKIRIFLSLWLEGCYSEAALFGVLCDCALIYGCKDCCCCSWAAWDDVGCPVGGGGGGGCTPACVLGEGGGVGRLNLSGLLLLLGEGLCGRRKDNDYTKSCLTWCLTCHGMLEQLKIHISPI